MPASSAEPVVSVLKQAFGRTGAGGESVESRLQSAAKRTMLTSGLTVGFDAPVRQVPATVANALRKGSRIILLNPGKKQNGAAAAASSNGSGGGKEESSSGGPVSPLAPPIPRRVFFQANQLEVGYRSPRVPGSGIYNLGNTCYLNSTLQALFHTPALYNYLVGGAHQAQCSRREQQQGGVNGLTGRPPCLICALTATLRETLHSPCARPSRIYDRLKSICKHLMHGRQEDAHEFLRYLIEALQRAFFFSIQVRKDCRH